MIRIAILVAVMALAGCQDKGADEARKAVEKMKELSASMCACKDWACADKVDENKTRWREDMAKTRADRNEKFSEAIMKELIGVSDKYTECMTKLMTEAGPPTPPEPPEPPAKPETPPAAPATTTVPELLTMARAFASSEDPPMVTAAVEASYVDADGKLDPEAGELRIVLGTAAQPADDPKRRTGVPAKPRAAARTRCMRLHWTAARGWWPEGYHCVEVRPPYPLCSVTEIWKRAIAKGAPADAVAVVQISESLDRQWLFSITDEPRNVKIQHLFADNCALAVEKP